MPRPWSQPLPITAWSAVNALGSETPRVRAALDRGESGLRAPVDVPLPFETVVGQVPDGELSPVPAPYGDYDCHHARLGLHALAPVRGAVEAAVDRWGPDRVAVIVGTSTGGLEATESAYFAWRERGALPPDFHFRRQHDFNALAELVACLVGAAGPTYTVSTACSSSGKVFASARRLLAADRIDAALVGGVDSLCRMTLQGFHGLGVLSSAPCQPFGAGRAGINIGEGAAWFVLERASIHAQVEVLGVGESSDAHHMSSPHPEGRGAAAAMAGALDAAGLRPDDVDYLNAHGTATLLNDAAEAKAIASVFGGRVPVSSTKRFTGHLLGGAGATEVAFAVHAILAGRIPPNLGADPIDPAVSELDIVREPRDAPVRRALSNSFAFGGSNVSVLVGARA